MPELDPQARDLLDAMRAAGVPPPYTLSIAEARAQMRGALLTKGQPLALYSVKDTELPTPHGKRRLRLYRPDSGALPIALFLHGGGWTLNDIDTHDRLCRRIASQSGWLLASLDYRRAPEYKHPAPLEDALLGYRWLLDNAEQLGIDDSTRALVGESSGAAVAAALTLLLRELGAPPPTFQVLAYPVTDLPGRWASYEERGMGYTLDQPLMSWFLEQYLPADHNTQDQYLIPIAASSLSDLPPAFLMTAEFDPLRDEGIAYAQRLAAAGVPVEHVHAEDQMHGFLMLDRAIARAGELIDLLADALRRHAANCPDTRIP